MSTCRPRVSISYVALSLYCTRCRLIDRHPWCLQRFRSVVVNNKRVKLQIVCPVADLVLLDGAGSVIQHSHTHLLLFSTMHSGTQRVKSDTAPSPGPTTVGLMALS